MRLLRIIPALTIAIVFCATQAVSEQKIRMLKASKTPPEHIIKEEKAAQIKHLKPREKLLTVKELKVKLRALPVEREKVDKAEKGYRPTAQIENPRFSLASLNPLSVPEAQAQSQFAVTLDHRNRFYAASCRANFDATSMNPLYQEGFVYPTMRNYGSVKGSSFLIFNAPHAGWYIINFYARGGNRAVLKHWEYVSRTTQGYRQVASWNFDTGPYNEWQDYLTLQYLQGGGHYFTFNPEFNRSEKQNVYRITINSL